MKILRTLEEITVLHSSYSTLKNFGISSFRWICIYSHLRCNGSDKEGFLVWMQQEKHKLACRHILSKL